jgi:hypothetical protein
VTGVTITAAGSGYTSAPTIGFTPTSGGSGATATAVAGGAITGASVTAAGSGYTSVPSVTINTPGGLGVNAYCVVALTPTSIASIAITGGGVGYQTASTVTVTIAAPTSGTTATVSPSDVVVSGGTIASIGMTHGTPGSGYTSPPTVTINGGATAGLPAGLFYAYYTFLDSSGNETTVGFSQSASLRLKANDIPTLGMPPWPSWAASMNIYLSPPNSVPGPAMKYMTIPASQYGIGKLYPIGSPIPLNAALPTSSLVSPPTTNMAASHAPSFPSLVAYEGGIQSPIESNVTASDYLLHDLFAHPSYRDLVWGWYAMCQRGCPTLTGSGAVLANYYQMYNSENDSTMWVLAYGSPQPPGDGLRHAYGNGTTYAWPPTGSAANQYATAQGGLPADAHSHMGGPQGNASTALLGFRDWIDATGLVPPTPTPTPTPPPRSRRWFGGLRRPIMRLGR